jgi:hypothetical protein
MNPVIVGPAELLLLRDTDGQKSFGDNDQVLNTLLAPLGL